MVLEDGVSGPSTELTPERGVFDDPHESLLQGPKIPARKQDARHAVIDYVTHWAEVRDYARLAHGHELKESNRRAERVRIGEHANVHRIDVSGNVIARNRPRKNDCSLHPQSKGSAFQVLHLRAIAHEQYFYFRALFLDVLHCLDQSIQTIPETKQSHVTDDD